MSELAGRDLDATICEEIFGWKETYVGPDASGENEGYILTELGKLDPENPFCLPPKGKIHRAFFTPTYHRDLKQALELARRVQLPLDLGSCDLTPEPIALAALEHFRKSGKSS